MVLTNHNSPHACFYKSAALTLAIALHSLLLLGQSKANKSDFGLTQLTLKASELNSPEESDRLFITKELSLNTLAYEYASCVFQNELIVVSKRKIGSVNSSSNTVLDQSEYKLIGFSNEDTGWSKPHLLSNIFIGKENHGGITFSKDETRVFYTKASPAKPHIYQIYTAERKNKFLNTWQNIKQLQIADRNYSIENPWLSTNGKRLYFSSNMPGGFGGFDIYWAAVLKDGTLGKPVNLGLMVNSTADEKFPTLNLNTTKLYFASNRNGGYGGFDLFECFLNSGDYSKAVNLGKSINSTYDEIGFISTSDTTGFFSSNKNALSKNQNIYSFSVKSQFQN